MKVATFIFLIGAIGLSLVASLVYCNDDTAAIYYQLQQHSGACIFLTVTLCLWVLKRYDIEWAYLYIIARNATILALIEEIDEYTNGNITYYANDKVILVIAALITLYQLIKQWRKLRKKS